MLPNQFKFPAILPVLFVFLFVLFSTVAQAEITLIEHTGANDPTAHGWVDTGGNQLAGPLFDDMGTDAWSIDDNSVAAGSLRAYNHSLRPSLVAAAMSNGWTLSARLRVVDASDSVDFSISANFNADIINFGFAFGSQADGDPIVLLPTAFDGTTPSGSSFALEGGGEGYHTYDLVFDPQSLTADLFVDGIERISNYGGYTFVNGLNQIGWGAQQSNSTGHANYNLVTFTTVPSQVH